MSEFETTAYDTIAAAEMAIAFAGYYRNKAKCLWEHASTRQCVKVVRNEDVMHPGDKFFVQAC